MTQENECVVQLFKMAEGTFPEEEEDQQIQMVS